MRFHLPAFLVSDLRGEYRFDVATEIAMRTPYSTSEFALLSDAQRRAVRAYLLHMADDPEHAFHRPHIIRALSEYWTDPK